MINFLFFIAILGVALAVILPFFLLSRKPKSFLPGISYEILPPGFRRYTLSVPYHTSEEERAPLIIALHYAGHGMPYYGESVLQELVKPAFSEISPIIVAPDCPVKYWHQKESEKLVLELLDSIQKKFNIDPERILITGYSLGGMGTWHFAAHYPERFSAAIVMAGEPSEEVFDVEWKIPLMVIHGKEDEVFPFHKTRTIVEQLVNEGVDIEFRILENVKHYETSFYVAALKNAIPWLLDAWSNNGR